MEKIPDERMEREEAAERSIAFLEKSGIFKHIESGELHDVPFEEFFDFLVRMNGILRDVPIKDRTTDGDRVMLSGFAGEHLVPRHSDKESLLKEAYEACKELSQKDDARYLLPVAINAVHIFADGNGRTSRLINVLLTPHNSREDLEKQLRDALGIYGRFDSEDSNPEILNNDLRAEIIERHGLTVLWNENGGWNLGLADFTRLFTPERAETVKAKEFLEIRKIDGEFCFVAAFEYLSSVGKLEAMTVRRHELPSFNLEENYAALSIRKMDESLNDSEWDSIIENYFQLKREEVETLIDCFIHPDDHKMQDGQTARDYFISKVISKVED